ncbi:hypothetical protein Tco_0194457 [Tanacetum coccineum]
MEMFNEDNIQEYIFTSCCSQSNQGNSIKTLRWFQNQIRPPSFPPIQNNQNRFNPNQGNNFYQNRGTNFNQNRGSNFNQDKFTNLHINLPSLSAPPQQMQGVSKTDFENYVKANDAVLRNMQNQGQGLQNQMTNLTEMLSKFITSNTASSSNSGTLPSQTVTNPREHVNAITTRSGKTCEGPSTPLVPTPVVSTPLKEPEQNPETSMDKVQKPSSENTAQVPPPEDHDSIPKPKAKKTVQEPNSPDPDSYQPKLPYPERMKVREKDKPSAQHSSTLLRNKEKNVERKSPSNKTVNAECSAIIMNKVLEKLEDPGKFLIPCALQELDRTNALADSGSSINIFCSFYLHALGLGALKPTAELTLRAANRVLYLTPMGIAGDVVVRVDDEPFSGSTTNHSDALPSSSSPVKTSEILEEFADELPLPKKISNFPITRKMCHRQSNVQVTISFPVSLIPLRIVTPVKKILNNPPTFSRDLFPPGVENDDSENEDN